MNAGSEDNARLEGLSGILRNWEYPMPYGTGIGEAELLMQSLSSAGLGVFLALGVSWEKFKFRCLTRDAFPVQDAFE